MDKNILNLIRKDIPEQFNENSFLKKHFDRVVQLLNGNIIPPHEIIIQPSSICNLKCIWCIGKNLDETDNSLMVQRLKDPKNMEKMLNGIISYKKILKSPITGKEKEYKVEKIQFSGLTGEPLFHKEAILHGMKILIDHNISVGMFSNGVLMGEDTWDTIAQINYVLISLDAGSEETYSKLKFGGNKDIEIFKKVCKNISGLINKKVNSGSKLDVNVGYVINPYNFEEIFQAAKIMKDLGVHYFRIKTDISSNYLLNDIEISKSQDFLQKMKDILEDENFKIVHLHSITNEEEKKRHFNKCFMNSIMSSIASDGNVYPCNYCTKIGRFYYGNSIDEPFGDIYERKLELDIKNSIPSSCPKVCDPYKNRSNRLLNAVQKAYESYGNEFINELMKY